MTGIPRRRAPQEDGEVLADPPLARVGALLAENRRRLAEGIDIQGRPLGELRGLARQEALAAAVDYLAGAGETLPFIPPSGLVLAGHQPELFHPGVWVKNFALQGIARAHGCTPLNLVVDNDTAKSTGLRLPVRSLNREGAGGPLAHDSSLSSCDPSVGLRVEPFDRWTGEMPYEELHVQDESLFATFAARAMENMDCWNLHPLLPEFWAEACRQAPRTPLLGERFAAARRWLERRWGCHNLEVPISALCRTEAFAWFAGHLLGRLADFHEIYNRAVREYRQRFGIRSRNHPVPDLAADGDWLETPFWGWRAGQSRRGRLFARLLRNNRIELRVGMEEWPSLSREIGDWNRLLAPGFKVRFRALTTTLFARVFLGDLFIHGIGGAAYDALTDEIIRRFYCLEPPGFLTLSATLHLPLPTFPIRLEQYRQLAHRLRDLEYNPHRHLPATVSTEVSRLVQDKQSWIDRAPAASAGRKERFRAIRSINEKLHSQVADQEDALRRELACRERQLAANAILQRRDYAFCLFPEAKLRPFCERFLSGF